MHKSRLFAGLVLGILAFTVPAASLADEAASPGPDGGYTVKKGDTLWDLSGQYMKAPANWPDLWKANPQLKDPDLIYPGDTLNIPGMAGGEAASPGEAGSPCEPAQASGARPGLGEGTLGRQKEVPFVDMGKTVLRQPEGHKGDVIVVDGGPKERQPLASVISILNAGFVADNGIKTMKIAGSPQINRGIFTLTEQVYIADDGSLKPGDKLMSFRKDALVDNPATGNRLGNIMIVSGLMDVRSRSGNYALAEVTGSFTDIRISDLVVPYADPPLFYAPVPDNPALKGKWGYVTALMDNRNMGTQEGVVYINLGSNDGVLPGDSFEVRRSGGRSQTDDGYFDPRKYVLPDVKVADAMVLSVQPDTATAVLTTGSEPVRPGYRVYYVR